MLLSIKYYVLVLFMSFLGTLNGFYKLFGILLMFFFITFLKLPE